MLWRLKVGQKEKYMSRDIAKRIKLLLLQHNLRSACAPSQLIRVLVVRMKRLWVPTIHRTPRSDIADSSLVWVFAVRICHFISFSVFRLNLLLEIFHYFIPKMLWSCFSAGETGRPDATNERVSCHGRAKIWYLSNGAATRRWRWSNSSNRSIMNYSIGIDRATLLFSWLDAFFNVITMRKNSCVIEWNQCDVLIEKIICKVFFILTLSHDLLRKQCITLS